MTTDLPEGVGSRAMAALGSNAVRRDEFFHYCAVLLDGVRDKSKFPSRDSAREGGHENEAKWVVMVVGRHTPELSDLEDVALARTASAALRENLVDPGETLNRIFALLG